MTRPQHPAVNQHYDIIIIGTGAGGGTMAQALVADVGAHSHPRARRFRPQESENWDPEAVWKHLRYRRARNAGSTSTAGSSRPYTHYGVGGNTKFWGSVLYRLRREDFQAIEHVDGVSPAWPIDYDTLEPYYDRAERLYHVRGEARHRSDGTGPRPLSVRRRSARAGDGGHRRQASRAGAASLAACRSACCRPGEDDGCILCNTCNSFACKLHAKSEADVVLRAPGDCASERDAVDEFDCDAGWSPIRPAAVVTAVEVERNGEIASRRGAGRRGVVRRGQLGGAAAAIGERQASRRPGEFLGAGRTRATWRISRR